MPNLEFLKPTFDRLASDSVIGEPTGKLAYAYMRVSSDDQADEGRSGIPRQLQHIHEAACINGYKIPWEMIFADDCTGFEFVQRPQLTLLRNEFKMLNRRADAIVMEHLDRLSRNADWHQGFLLDEMKSHNVIPIFWKAYSSRIERAVMGVIAQDGMEQSKQRMMEGNLHKARSGRVTARTPAYGYKFVDADGKEGVPAKKDTYYAIQDNEAAIVRLCFQRLIAGDSLRRIAIDLEASGVLPPKQYKHWESAQVRLFITNEVYKGDFYAHRWHHTTIKKPSRDGLSVRNVKVKIERPREEWIHVAVPPIVGLQEWETANRMLEQNKKTARRNALHPFLLTGLVKCAHCGWTFTGTTHRNNRHGNPRKTEYRGYRCPHNSTRPSYLREHTGCKNSYIRCDILDKIVWSIVCQALLKPEVLLEALASDATNERNRQLKQQIAYLERELIAKMDDDERLLRAYLAEAFDEHEFAAQRRRLKEEMAKMNEDLIKLGSQVLTPHQLEQRKNAVLTMSEQIRSQNIPIDPPFELKQRIIKLVVDKIVLNVTDGWLQLDGAIRGTFSIESTHNDRDNHNQTLNTIENTHGRMDYVR